MTESARRFLALVAAALFAGTAWFVVAGVGLGSPPIALTTTSPSATHPSQASAAGCGHATVTVDSSDALQDALDDAQPGDVIVLAPGTFIGRFVATADGTARHPIVLCGPEDAVLDGGGTDKGYTLHLAGTAHWTVTGFSVRHGQKGVMADGISYTTISSLNVSEVGDEGIHLRRFSVDNIVTGNTIHATGLRKPKFGEGIYIGTAHDNWCDVTTCKPDRSDRNIITANTVFDTTAESVDIKEGTSNGVLSGNNFDGSNMVKSDSWVDIKGNGWIISSNVGANSPRDGFQSHQVVDGWGTRNIFRANTAVVNGPGYGIALNPVLDNVVECSNTASNAGRGLSNIPCSG